MLQDSSPRPITILHASMTGRAQFLALQLADELDARGIDCTVLDMNDADVKTLSAGGLFLICTSTFGQGEVPDNAQFLFQELEAARPDLAAVDYGVLALGDRSYLTTFCYGGKRFDALLRGLGARRIGSLFEHDASTFTAPEASALPWLEEWLQAIGDRRRAACAESTS